MSRQNIGRRRHGFFHSGFWIVLRDAALLAAALNVFALFHHVLPRKLTPAADMPVSTAAPEPLQVTLSVVTDASALPVTTPAPTPAPGDFSESFPSYDTGSGALYSYQTDTVRISINQVQADSVTYFLADVYVKNIEAFHTAFAKDTYGKNIYEFPLKTADANGAVFAVTGDYYSARSKGLVVRNGKLYRSVANNDACVLYQNGEMETYTNESPDLSAVGERGIWQAWSFGPALLTKDGKAVSEFTSDLKNRHPRCGIGYYAPGHYCFIVVDGRQEGYSIGMRLVDFAQLFESLGCMQAYNLDGGTTAMMLFRGEVVNRPYNGGRESGDIIYFK